MKALFLLLTLSTHAFAQTNFLNANEAASINLYMDNICPDTYCGGDIVYYTQGITCRGDSCTIKMRGSGDSVFDPTAINSVNGKSVTSSKNKNVVVNFEQLVLTDSQYDDLLGLELNFSCTLNNLTKQMNNYGLKRDLFYDMIVFGCISHLEDTVYNF